MNASPKVCNAALAAAVLMCASVPPVQAADVVIDLTGLQSRAALGDTSNVRLTLDAQPGSVVDVINWNLTGKPVNRNGEWLGESLNFAGFPLSSANPSTFQAFFGGAAPLTNAALYRLNASGVWTLAAMTATMPTTMPAR